MEKIGWLAKMWNRIIQEESCEDEIEMIMKDIHMQEWNEKMEKSKQIN